MQGSKQALYVNNMLAICCYMKMRTNCALAMEMYFLQIDRIRMGTEINDYAMISCLK